MGYPYIKITTHDPARTSHDLYIAAAIYLGFALISLVYWFLGARRIRLFQNQDGATFDALHTP